MNNYNNRRKEIHDAKSYNRLSRNMKKKIQTTMIGALSSVEKHFSFLWEQENISEEQRESLKRIYDNLRSEILDKGNHQLRNIDAELSDYTISLHSNVHDINFFVDNKEEN